MVYAISVTFFFSLSPQAGAIGGNYSWNSDGTISVSGSPYLSNGTISPQHGKWVLTSDTRANLGQGACSYGSGANSSGSLIFTVDKSKNQINFSSFSSSSGSQSCAPGSAFQTGPSTIGGKPSTPTNTDPQSCDDYRATNPTLGTACGQGMTYASQGLDAGNSACDKDRIGGGGSNGVSAADLLTACKLGVKLGVAQALTTQFASIKTAACSGESGGTAASCMSSFDSNLQACVNSANGDPQKVKDCMKTKYPSLASQIDALNTGGKNDPTCVSTVPGIGWLMCPVLDAMAGVADGIWGALQQLLEADPLLITNSDGSPSSYFRVWQMLLSIANVILVIAFLFIIYSQLTSAGISNYGIKKMLPKLLIVAILINASFYLASAMVDIFNVFGRSLYSIFKGVYTQIADPMVGWDKFANLIAAIIAAGAGGGLLVAGIAIAGGAEVALFLLIPIVLSAVIGVLIALITLMFRQAAIPLLAILSPIALACLLLPNMEQWFTRWRKAFFAMLLLYPIAAVLFGGLQLAGKVIASAPGTSVFSLITALVIMMIPPFMLPFIAAKAEGFLGQMNSKLTGSANRLTSAVKNWSDGRAENSKARYDAAAIRTNKNGRPILRDRLRGIRRNFQGRKNIRDMQTAGYKKQSQANLNEGFMAQSEAIADKMDEQGMKTAAGYTRTIGASMASKAEGEEVEQYLIQHKSKHGATGITQAVDAMKEAIENNNVAMARAMQQYLANAGAPGVQALNKVYEDSKVGSKLGEVKVNADGSREFGEMRKSLGGDALSMGIKSKSAAIDKYFTEKEANNRSFSQISNDSSTYTALNAVELAGQKNLDGLIASGKITQQMAAAIMQNQNATAQAGLGNVAALQQLAGQAVPSPAATQIVPGEPKLRGGPVATESGFLRPRDMK